MLENTHGSAMDVFVNSICDLLSIIVISAT